MVAQAQALWALDFDGVVCDSVGESSLSAWKAATALWPDIFDTDAARDAKAGILEDMRVVRPVVETGEYPPCIRSASHRLAAINIAHA